MKSTTRLDSVVFQLTPTRTRCDLIIIAKGKKETIASGLLNPFIDHLKTAQDQIEKGGYSILLEPDSDGEAKWFTKDTVERFVRFVRTPAILERVYTLELEILQIEGEISIQRSNGTGQSTLEEHDKPTRGGEDHKLKPELGEEKSIVLYTPGAHQPKPNCESSQEGNSRVQLLKVLETRKAVIQKEQGMAFARAVAAGFEVDNISPLVSFAKCYGASRLMDACIRFTDLWKKKHENGQWLEIEAAQSISGQPFSSPTNSSGIVLYAASKEIDLNGDLASPGNQKPQIETSAGERPRVPDGQQEYFQGQFPNQMFPTWPVHSPPGVMPMFPAYPVQGMPYYQAFPGNIPFYQPPHPHMEDYQVNATPKPGEKRQSKDGGDCNQNSGSFDSNTSKSCSPDGLELDKNASQSSKSHKKSGQSRKNQSGVVVIRNINYIASEAKSSASESSTDSEADNEGEDILAEDVDKVPRKVSKPFRRKVSQSRSIDKSNNDLEENSHVNNQSDYGNWQAFQGFLLNGADEEAHTSKDGLISMENGTNVKRRLKTDCVDPLSLGGRDPSELQDRKSRDVHEANGKLSHKFRVSNDANMFPGTGSDNVRTRNNETNMHLTEANGRNVIPRSSDDNFLVENRDQFPNLSESLAVNGFERDKYRSDAVSSNKIGDDSFMMTFRSSSLPQVGPEDRITIDMDSELPSANQKSEDIRIAKELSYEADDMNLVPERGTERRRSTGYDPALDYEMQVYAGGSVSRSQNAAKVAIDAKKGTLRLDRSRSSKANSESMDKKTTGGPIRKLKPSKLSPLEDARARADNLRAFKADIQKLKKEQEDADLKRLDALKSDRQKRIAARNNSSSSTSLTAPSPQMRKAPSKLSPVTNRGSKFNDLETGSSPLQRSKVRVSVGSSESKKPSKSMKPSEGSLLPGNGLSKSVSSLPQQKKDSSIVTPDSKVSAARVRRLSEPKTVGQRSTTTTKVHSAEPAPKLKSDGPDSKKISAIINLDKIKAALLPELKLRTPKGNSNSAQKKLAGKDTTKLHQAKPSATSENYDLDNDISPNQNELDDNPIIDKTIVVLENDKPSIPAVHGFGNGTRSHNFQYDNHHRVEEHRTIPEFSSIHAPPSSNPVLHSDSKPDHLQDKSNCHEVKNYHADDTSRFSDVNPTEIPYHAPIARSSSLEEPGKANSDFGEPSPTSPGTLSTSKAYISAEKASRGVDCITEALDKIQVKESPKGFRRLLKFGKKNHNSASMDESTELVTTSNNDGLGRHTRVGDKSSNEVYTLKNLISEEETPAIGSSSKSSRHFSLLSPFRSKTGEKKLTTT